MAQSIDNVFPDWIKHLVSVVHQIQNFLQFFDARIKLNYNNQLVNIIIQTIYVFIFTCLTRASSMAVYDAADIPSNERLMCRCCCCLSFVAEAAATKEKSPQASRAIKIGWKSNISIKRYFNQLIQLQIIKYTIK